MGKNILLTYYDGNCNTFEWFEYELDLYSFIYDSSYAIYFRDGAFKVIEAIEIKESKKINISMNV